MSTTVLTDDEAKLNIAANVRALLSSAGMSQSELARKLEESEARVSLMIHAKKLSSAAFLARVAEVLGTTVDSLLAAPQKNSRRSA